MRFLRLGGRRFGKTEALRRQQYPSTPEEAERAFWSTEALLALPLAERVEKCLELGMRNVPVDQAEKTEYERANTPGLVVYDTPVEPMTHERLAALARPHAPREGEVTPEHIAAWTKEKTT